METDFCDIGFESRTRNYSGNIDYASMDLELETVDEPSLKRLKMTGRGKMLRGHSIDIPHDGEMLPSSIALKRHFMKRTRRRSVADPFDYEEQVPIPEVPEGGVRIKVCYAGACYSNSQACGIRIRMAGIRDTSLFPGYEVSGLIDELDKEIDTGEWKKGDRVVVFPYEDVINKSDLSEYITVTDLSSLVRIPESVPLDVAAMMPSGAVMAYNAVLKAKEHIKQEMSTRGVQERMHILLIGAGGLGLTTLVIANHFLSEFSPDIVRVVVADSCAEKLAHAERMGCLVIHWCDHLYEQQILERTLDICPGGVDVAIDFVSSPRTTTRVLKILNNGGLVVSGDHSRSCIRVHPEQLSEKDQRIVPVPKGNPEQLKDLLDLLDKKEILPPPYEVFPVEDANNVFSCLQRSQHIGRAVFKVSKEDLESVFEN
ncbi:NADP-dependent alcohol dehydrogenase C 1-like isoform X2 [Lineus longissimus]|uniref:NADP-dependent alcohol dehydrogenase C 1-like isoform X2 n=1 Tax=Lineus longissimus TaxID=88925 RepID=UPI00315DA924